MKRIVSFDIDGVLNNYPDCWLKYLNSRTHSSFKSIFIAKEKMDEELYISIKDEYRLMGEKSIFTISNKEMIQVINKFFDAGFYVIISTSRPLKSVKYPNLYDLTFDWLLNEGVKFSELIYKDDSLTNHRHLLDEILFHIDDESKYIDAFKKFDIQSYLYSFVDKQLCEISFNDLIKIKNKNASIF
ncbi:hypothetical protein GD586_08975 [Pseudarcicella sp. GAP-15]|nr:hypothetical protein [Pseudarcicella sp. GAP-15]